MNRLRRGGCVPVIVVFVAAVFQLGCGSPGASSSNPLLSLKTISITPANPSIAAGNSQTFTATGVYSDGSQKDVTREAAWASATASVATIASAADPQPVKGVSAGSSMITASMGAISGNTLLTVTPPVLSSIAVTPANPSILAGSSQAFTATGTYSDGSQLDLTSQALWSSGTTSVATIGAAADPQPVNGISAGTSTITASVGAISGHTLLTVNPTLNSIAVTPANPSVQVGTVEDFTATGTFSDGSHKDVTTQATWTSGTTSVATIGAASDPQPVNAISVGSSTITAKIGGVSGGTLLTVAPPSVSVSVRPRNAAVVVTTQTQQFSATVTADPNNLGVTWSVDGIPNGGASIGTISSSGLYTPPSGAGNHTVTATSVADTSKTASAAVAVTDLAGVITYHYDQARDGVNSHEYSLNTANVNKSTFGKLFSCTVDGAVYTEPLWVPSLSINGAVHNVIFVATQHDTLFAFDADANPCQQLWEMSLIDAAHGGNSGDTPVVDTAAQTNVGVGDLDITPEIGVTGTPVIDPNSNTLYVVSKSQNTTSGTLVFNQRLHAIDLTTGAERFSGPVSIAASVAGHGFGSSGGIVTFNTQNENQRPALALVNGVVYIGWAAHEDKIPYNGWLIGYNASNVQQQVSVFNSTPNGTEGGIWMSGGGPAIDSSGNLYFTTGNGTFDANSTTLPNNDFGETALKMSTAGVFSLADYFTPDNQFTLSKNDADLASGGVVLLPDQTGPVAHLLVAGGKEGVLYLVDRDNMGHFQAASNSQIVQSFSAENGSFSTPVFWQNNLYIAGAVQGSRDNLKMYTFNPISGQFATTPASFTAHSFPFPGSTPALSSQGTSHGIVWAVDSSCWGTPSPCGSTALPATLYAYDATNVGSELWDSTQAASNRDQAGPAVKFSVPTVANGKVYLGTRTEVDVYGLLP